MTLIVLALLAWWLSRDRQPAPPRERDVAAEAPDYFFGGFTLRATDDTGRWKYQVQSDKVLHFPTDDRWELATPLMEAYPSQGAPWYGRAEQGVAWPEQDLVDLLGEVRLRRPDSPSNRPVEIDTENVRVHPGRDYAETAAPTEVRQGLGRLRGTGARAWLDEERIEFLSNVKGRYVPEDQ